MKQIIFKAIVALILASIVWFTNWIGFGLITGDYQPSHTLKIIFWVAFAFGFVITKAPAE